MEHIFTAQMDLSLFCRTLLEGAVAIEGELGETASGGTFGERGKHRFAKCPKWVIIKLSKYHEQAFPASKRAAFSGRRGRHAGSGAWTKEAKRERAGFVHVQRERDNVIPGKALRRAEALRTGRLPLSRKYPPGAREAPSGDRLVERRDRFGDAD